MELTPEQIDAMQPGEELDKLVAERVFGWVTAWSRGEGTWEDGEDDAYYVATIPEGYAWFELAPKDKEWLLDNEKYNAPYVRPEGRREDDHIFRKGKKTAYVDLWHPSTDITAAWQVVEKLGWGFYITSPMDNPIWGDASAGKYHCFMTHCPNHGRWTDVIAYADTAPEAICKAALKATLAKE